MPQLDDCSYLKGKKDLKEVVVSGIRPTGRMHLGNYHGAIKNWLNLQDQYECYFFVADLHALTTHYQEHQDLELNTKLMITDWLAAGLNPKKCNIFIQSMVPSHAEMHLLLSMMTPLSWLERVPTYKSQQQQLKHLDLATYGFLGYPLLQGADVLLYKAQYVPVGEDQVAHIELIREVARRFNNIYAKEQIILQEPQPLLTNTPKLPGIDGRKMSKSYHNVIELAEDKLSIEKKIKTMPTDPARVRRTDCGDPDKCPVWQLHKFYSDQEVKTWVDSGCRSASIGCLDCKCALISAIEKEQQPIRERANYYQGNKELINSIIEQGMQQSSIVAKNNLIEIKHAMGLRIDN